MPRPKKLSAKGSNFKEDNNALLICHEAGKPYTQKQRWASLKRVMLKAILFREIKASSVNAFKTEPVRDKNSVEHFYFLEKP